MILYHGTSSANTDSILASSNILPRKHLGTRGNWYNPEHVSSLDEFVYLSSEDQQVHFHALRTALITGGNCTVLGVETNEDNFYPDENLFAPQLIVYAEDMVEMQKKVLINKDLWKDSLKKRGMVCHKDSIPAENIKTVKHFPITESMYYCFIKNFGHTLEGFTKGYNLFLRLQEKGWYEPTVKKLLNEGFDKEQAHEHLMRNLEFIPLGGTKYFVTLFERNVNVEWTT